MEPRRPSPTAKYFYLKYPENSIPKISDKSLSVDLSVNYCRMHDILSAENESEEILESVQYLIFNILHNIICQHVSYGTTNCGSLRTLTA
jgi:hypothetical protein